MNLQLSLKKQWFEMTKAGVKTEDYRELSPYFYSRLCLYRGEPKTEKWWREYFDEHYSLDQEARTTFKKIDQNIMTWGYPKSNDTERTLKFDHAGIEIREGNPDWGAEPGKLYFVIKHGNKILL